MLAGLGMGHVVLAPDKAATTCPEYLGGHALESVDIFDGPPSNFVGIHPVPGGWLFHGERFSKGVFLVCNYRGTTAQNQIRLPNRVQACWFGYNWPHVVCR